MENFILINLIVMFVSIGALMLVYVTRVRKVGPNEVLIISGREKSPRVVTGGALLCGQLWNGLIRCR